jgi:hypothetical protein
MEACLQHDAVIKARCDYELDRYDLVENLNCLDCNKKIIITNAIQKLFGAYKQSGIFIFSTPLVFDTNEAAALKASQAACTQIQLNDQAPAYFTRVEKELTEAVTVMEANSHHWSTLRKKLAGPLEPLLYYVRYPLNSLL